MYLLISNFQINRQIKIEFVILKVDTVEYIWNIQCSAVLLLTTAEVDKSGASYYGEQGLFFLSTRGDSMRVTFCKWFILPFKLLENA